MKFRWFVCFLILCGFSGLLSVLLGDADDALRPQGASVKTQDPPGTFSLTPRRLTPGNVSSRVIYLSDEVASDIDQVRQVPEAQWQRLRGPDFNLGYSDHGYWLRVDIDVADTGRMDAADSFTHAGLSDWTRADSWLLAVQNDYQELRLYREALGDEGLGSLRCLFDSRTSDETRLIQTGRHRTLPIDLQAGSQFRLYLYVRSLGATQFPLSLLPSNRYLLSETSLLSAMHVAVGALCSLVVLSLVLGLVLREPGLAYYGFFVLFITMIDAAAQELPEQWFGPIPHFWQQQIIFLGAAFSEIALALFTRDQMRSPGSHPLYPKVLLGLAWFAALLPLLTSLLLPLPLQRECTVVVATGYVLFCLWVGVHNSLRRQRAAILYTGGMAVFFLGTLSLLLNKIGVIPVNLFTDNLQLFGSVFSAIIFLVAVSERFVSQRRSRQAAQQRALAFEQMARESQAQLLQLERQATEALEAQVQARTAELETTLAELQRANAAAELAKSQAETANRQKTRFLAAASHDIRQPLQALSLLAEGLEMDVRQASQPPVGLDTGRKIRLAVGNLIQLFDTLFDLSKLDNQLVQPQLQALDLVPFLREFADAVRPLCRQADVILALELASTSVPTLTDPILLQRILRILVDNALQHSGCRQLRLQLTHSGEQGLLTVVDDGVGIPRHEQKNVFEEFYQLKNPERDRRKGMGLGLALCQRLVDLLGWKLRLESDAGQGSAFQLQLPVRAEAVPVAAAMPAAPLSDYRRLRVLVVDDDNMAGDAMLQLLERWGADGRLASGSQQVWSLLGADWTPQMAILDYRLPDSDNGVELAAKLRQRLGADLPVLIITGDMDLEPGEDTLRVLHKPIRPSVLRTALNQLLPQTDALSVGG